MKNTSVVFCNLKIKFSFVVLSVPEKTPQTDSFEVSSTPSVGSQVPQFTKLLDDVEVFEGQPARLECRVKGKPTPRIEWLKDSSHVKPNKRVKTSFDGETCVLEF